MMNHVHKKTPELQALASLFYSSLESLGNFEEADSSDIPPVYQDLLDHDKHMTVTVEVHHGCPVDLQVLDIHVTETHYARKILLARHTDGAVVQFGIVRLNVDYLGPEVRRKIEDHQGPLGRILIDHNVLRNVRLLSLWKITPATELARLLALDRPQTCYGRTALIYCNGIPAVELLEIVAPC